MKTLVLIEGLFGSGKSTTAENISNNLCNDGFSAKYYVEANQENPVGLKMSLEEADNTIKATRHESYPYNTWKNLTIEADSFMIIEARLIQDSSFWAMLNGEKIDNCIDLPQKIINSISNNIDVKLIAFEHSSPKSHILKVIEERKKEYPNWLPYICDLFENQQWAKNKKITGLNGFIETQLEWSTLFTTIVQSIECNKLIITDPDTDWVKTIETINNYLLA